MNIFFLGICSGLLPALIAALVITRKSSAQVTAMRERLAAEEASKRHFIDLATKHEGTVALLTQELHRLEVENTLLRSRIPAASEIAA